MNVDKDNHSTETSDIYKKFPLLMHPTLQLTLHSSQSRIL